MSKAFIPLFLNLGFILGAFLLQDFNSWAADTPPNTEPTETSTTTHSKPNNATTPKSRRIVLDRLEASVNSSIILHSDIQKFKNIAKLRSQLDPLFAGTTVAAQGEQASDKEIVDFLVDEAIISQQFPKSDAEVEQEINSIQANNHIDRATLKATLEKEGFNFSDYSDLIRSSSSKRDLIERDIRTKVTISDDDIKNYYLNHYSRNNEGDRTYHLKIITISKSNYKTPTGALETAKKALKAIQSGEPFEEVARSFSDDPSASSGGDLGSLTEDQMSSSIRDQVKGLKVGQASGLLGGGSSDRFFILKLVNVTTDNSEQIAKVKEQIRTHLVSNEYQHQISLWLDRQKQAAFIHKAGEPSVKELPIQP